MTDKVLEVIFTDGTTKHTHVYPSTYAWQSVQHHSCWILDENKRPVAVYEKSWLICIRGNTVDPV